MSFSESTDLNLKQVVWDCTTHINTLVVFRSLPYQSSLPRLYSSTLRLPTSTVRPQLRTSGFKRAISIWVDQGFSETTPKRLTSRRDSFSTPEGFSEGNASDPDLIPVESPTTLACRFGKDGHLTFHMGMPRQTPPHISNCTAGSAGYLPSSPLVARSQESNLE